MRIATPTLAILAAAAGLAATLAVPASAAQANATSAHDCTKPEAVAKLNGYGATVNNAAVQDVDGYHQLAPGQTLVMAISGTLAEEVKGGKARIGLMREGQEKPEVVEAEMAKLFTNAEAKPIQFPVAAGPFTWYLRAQVPDNTPPAGTCRPWTQRTRPGVRSCASRWASRSPPRLPAPAPAPAA